MSSYCQRAQTHRTDSYWGQDGAGSQQRLSFYCQDDTVDVIPLAFLYIFRGTGGEPVIDFANVSARILRPTIVRAC